MYIELFTLIVLIAVATSLIFSVTALVIMLVRRHRRKHATTSSAKNQHKSLAQHLAGHVPQPHHAFSSRPSVPPSSNNPPTVPLFEENALNNHSPIASQLIYHLHWQEIGPHATKDHHISVRASETFYIGRAQNANLQITHNTVARKQCLLSISQSGGVDICNLSNSNKTKLNGRYFEGAFRLQSGDMISIGEVQLLLLNMQ